MPHAFSSHPLSSENPPSLASSKGNMRRAPLRTILAPITKEPAPSAGKARPVFAQKRTPSPPMNKDDVGEEESPRLPTATIDVESVSDVMAARLMVCLLGHVLFLKSQVPFPVAQLIKLSARKTDSRPNKKLDKLLTTFDVLSSHLGSTFTALSCALSLKSGRSECSRLSEKVHLAIVLGPTATAVNHARARVILEFDGFHVAAVRTHSTFQSRGCAAPNSDLKENKTVFLPQVASDNSKALNERSKGLFQRAPLSNGTDERPDDEDDTVDSSVAKSPAESESESESESEFDETESASESSFMSPSPRETESNLAAAERLFSRTLAIANSDPKLGMAAEIRPTQIHILLRAPRRFEHPEWIPQQETSRKYDALLSEFDEPPASSDGRSATLNNITSTSLQPVKQGEVNTVAKVKADAKRKGPGGVKTDYVRVRSRGAELLQLEGANITEAYGDASDPEHSVQGENTDGEQSDKDKAHDDELIWWSWRGKLEGFTFTEL